ncbi:helix-turn-helix domain-containing protein [Halorubrum sp. SD683]|uniref:winged helix-turn-helix domain-containing protein n=1 Tax=Halorubrum sp. SD683 TaxID=1855873 RepID=UPI000A2D8676|nr:helix-turn-helix domain-containing protein [Halorubrum sp. SD683]OTF01707.1 hypothetical protein B9G49_00130 [Halorubrum sp. SD683]
MCETPMDGELDGLVRVLAHPVRRTVLRQLAANPEGATIERLAETVGDPDGDADGVAARELTLHHVHLPKLEAAGLLTYDPDCGRVDPSVGVTGGSAAWQAVTAIDSVVALVESESRRAVAAHADGGRPTS